MDENQANNEHNDDGPDVAHVEDITSEHPAHFGPAIGVLIVVLVLILCGLYLWGSVLSNTNNEEQQADQTSTQENRGSVAAANTRALREVGSSDELDDIARDIQSTNLGGLTAELDTIEAVIEN